MCLLLAETSNFRRTYSKKLNDKGVAMPTRTSEKTMQSAIATMLRRHSIDKELCCGNENNLQVMDVDQWGFVTEVKCDNEIIETTCDNAKWTYERIYRLSKLKRGDHICWHRPYVIWHHAIVTDVEPEQTKIKFIHYDGCEVKRGDMKDGDSKYSALYRINYKDCYNADYSVLRAETLIGKSRYNLFTRNCEHFSRWCKTGSLNCYQVGVFLESAGKAVFMIGLRFIALLILFLFEWSHEVAEDIVEVNNDTVIVKNYTLKAKERQAFETRERWLTSVYLIITVVTFIIYLLYTSCSRLHPVRRKCPDTENSRQDDEQFSQRACCGRPCNLACGVFWRIVLREIPPAVFTLCVVLSEEKITNSGSIPEMHAGLRAFILVLICVAAQIGGYAVGEFGGRLVEGCYERRKCCEFCKPAQRDQPQRVVTRGSRVV